MPPHPCRPCPSSPSSAAHAHHSHAAHAHHAHAAHAHHAHPPMPIMPPQAGCSVTVEGELQASPAKGQATEVQAESIVVHGWPTRKPTPCRRSGTRSSICGRSPICGRGPTRSAPSPGCAIASASRSTNSSRSRAFSTSTRRSSRPAIAKGPGEMFKVTTLDLAKLPRPSGKIDYAEDFFGRPAYLTVSGQLEGRNLRLRAGQGLHVRADLPGRELEHLAAPGRVLDDRAGDGVLRTDRQHGPGRGVPQADRPRRARPLCRRHAVLRRARSTRSLLATLEKVVSQRIRAPHLYRSDRDPGEIGPEIRVPGRLGQRPAVRARTLSDRERTSSGR